MLVTISSIRINNNWNYQNILITDSTFPLKHIQACVGHVSINTCLTDVFIEEVQVPVAQVTFLNFVVLFLFYNFYVCFNPNYIVDILVIIICRVSWLLLVRKTISILFFYPWPSIYCCMHCSFANCRKAFAWTWFSCFPPSADSIF